MPGPLRDVEQRVSLNAEGYDRGSARVIEDSIAMQMAMDDTIRKAGELSAALGVLAGRHDIDISVTGRAMADIAAIDSALGSLHDREITVRVRYETMGDVPGGLAGAAFGSSAASGADSGAAAAVIRDTAAATRDAASQARDAASAEYMLAMAERMRANTARETAQATRDSATSVEELKTQIIQTDAAAARLVSGSYKDLVAGMASSRQAGGNAQALDALLAAAGGAAGGALGGGGGGGGGGFFGGLMSGAADRQWSTVASAVARVYPVIHYIMMATNELLATAGPAAIALGAGAAVGLQGGQQLYNRGQAINAVGQSLGPSLGQTPGSFAGLGQGLQHAQNLYGAGVYEMYGAVANSLKAGAGGGFDQMGEDVVAMADRATANMTIAFQKGLGTKLQGLMGQGVSDLAQFGDVAGNIGKTFVNVGANLPGVGGDILSTLQAGTGGLSKLTGFLGPSLGPLLAFEAASRYGPTLVGGAGALLRNTGIGVAGLGNDIAAGSGEGLLSDALMGGGMGLVGAGGFLGGLGALPIGAAGALAYMIGKTASYKTPYQQSDAAILSAVGQQGPVAGIPAIISGMNQMAGVGYSRPAPNWQLGSLGGSLVNQAVEGKPVISTAMSYEADQIRSTLASKMSGFGDVEKHWQGILSVGHDVLSMLGVEAPPPTPYQAAQKTLQSLSDTMVNALGTGKQVQGVWDGVSHSTVSMAAANNIATMAALQLGSAYEKNGKLTATAKTQIANLYAGYAPMVMNSGQFGAATGAMTAMSGLQGTQLANVNAAYDQLTGIVQGGAADAAGFFGLLSGTPVSSTRGGIKLPAAPAKGSMAAALGSFTSASGAAAWNTLTNTQTGQFPALEQQMDWLQTAQTLGALSSGQTTRMGAYEIAQMLPELGTNPAALSMLSPYAQRFGGPSFKPGESGATMQKALSRWAQKNGLTNAGFNQMMTTGTEKLGNIPSDSNQFVQTVQSNLVGGMAQGVATYGANLQDAFMTAIGKGSTGGTAESQYLGFLKKSGVPEAGAADMAQYAGTLAGASKPQLAAIKEMIDLVYKMGAPPKLPPVKGPTVSYDSKVHPPDAPPPPKGRTVNYPSHVQTPVAPPAPAGGTVVYHSVVIGPGPIASGSAVGGGGRMLYGASGMRVPGFGGGDIFHAMLEPGETVLPKEATSDPLTAALGSKYKVPGFQSGGVIGVPSYPGLGVSFRVAMQQVAQELLTDMQQALGSATGGGYGGGMRGGPFYGGPLQPSGGSPPPHGTLADPVAVHVASVAPPAAAALGGSSQFPGAAGPMPKAANKVIDAFEETFKNMPGPWNKLASQILTGLLDGVKNSTKETAAMATALVNKVTTEINYGRSVANTAVSGLNFPGMQVATPTMTAQGQPYQYYTDQQNIAAGGQPGSVQEQMSSYLQAEKSFQGDMSKLSKGGLEKRLLSQLYSAGPIQGDAEAQSIMGGAGGIKAANQLYNQINSLATKIGVGAIGNVYGQPATAGLHGKDVKVPVHADTAGAQSAINAIHGKTVTIEVKVDLGGGGSGGGSSSGITLSTQQVNAITSQVQAKLLQQAKRNRRTGTTLPGYGS